MKRVEPSLLAANYVWHDPEVNVAWEHLEGLHLEIVAGPSNDAVELTVALFVDYGTRREAYMRESMARENENFDWSGFSPERRAFVKEHCRQTLERDCMKLRAEVDEAIARTTNRTL